MTGYFSVFVVVAVSTPGWTEQVNAAPNMLIGQRVSMRDGCELATDVYFPKAGHHGGPYPAILRRTPYGRAQYFELLIKPLLEAGYVVAVQDVRGRYDSDGDWYPYFNEGEDGYDSIQWLANQLWCDGQVGMLGGSYCGWVQWAAAREQPPALKAMVSMACCADFTGEWPWINGVLFPGAIGWSYEMAGRVNQNYPAYPLEADGGLSCATLWPRADEVSEPLSDFGQRYGRQWAPGDDWLAHPVPDEYWKPVTLAPEDFAAINVPVLHISGWWDGCQRGCHKLYEQMRRYSPASARQRLLVGPWDHAVIAPRQQYDGFDFTQAAVRDTMAEHIAWFDRFLKADSAVPAKAAVEVFITGRNAWDQRQDFPPQEQRAQHWYLSADRQLSPEPPREPQPADAYVYDPADPVWTLNPDTLDSYARLDRTLINQRTDVLVYRSAPLFSALLMEGRPWMELVASSDCPDTDWVVQLLDIQPDGREFLVGQGILRARFREGLGQEIFMQPGQRHHFHIDLNPRAHEFRPEHRIGVAITSSAAPLWAPNPNLDGDISTQTGSRVAHHQIHHSPDALSWVELPVISK